MSSFMKTDNSFKFFEITEIDKSCILKDFQRAESTVLQKLKELHNTHFWVQIDISWV